MTKPMITQVSQCFILYTSIYTDSITQYNVDMPSSSYDNAKHIVDVHEKILAVFIVGAQGNMSDLLYQL